MTTQNREYLITLLAYYSECRELTIKNKNDLHKKMRDMMNIWKKGESFINTEFAEVIKRDYEIMIEQYQYVSSEFSCLSNRIHLYSMQIHSLKTALQIMQMKENIQSIFNPSQSPFVENAELLSDKPEPPNPPNDGSVIIDLGE